MISTHHSQWFRNMCCVCNCQVTTTQQYPGNEMCIIVHINLKKIFFLSAIDSASHEVCRYCLKQKNKSNWLITYSHSMFRCVHNNFIIIPRLFVYIFFFHIYEHVCLLDKTRALFYFVHFSSYRRTLNFSMPSIHVIISIVVGRYYCFVICHVKRKNIIFTLCTHNV